MNIASLTEEILYKVEIKDYLERLYGLTFKSVGNSYMTNCPLHGEKTPSFSLPKNKNYFNCFGCGEGGTVIDFVQKYENLDRKEAITKVCNDVGIDIKQARQVTKLTNHSNSKKKLSIEYTTNLINNKDALNYLKEDRQLSLDTIKKFKLGSTSSNEKKECYNNRIVFPIANSTYEHDILAFSYGYIKDKDNYDVKYINESTNEFFKKSTLLYGYNESLKAIRETEEVFLVEGYFDVISMHESGLENTLGVMCANISQEQIELIKKLNCKVNLLLDNDTAGIKGMKKAIFNFAQHDIVPNVITTKYNDADEICKALKHDKYRIINELKSNTINGLIFALDKEIQLYNSAMLDLQHNILTKAYQYINLLSDTQKEIYKNYINKLF